MIKTYTFWGSLLVLCFILDGLSLRYLALQNVSVAESLIMRGVGCLFLVFLLAAYKGYSLIPNSLSSQILRAVVAGLALSFITWSYQDLTASAVSTLSNADVPLLLILGPLWGEKEKKSTFIFSILLIFVLFILVAQIEREGHLYRGILNISLGTFLICFGYKFIKKSMEDENKAVAILTPALSILLYGALEIYFSKKIVLSAHNPAIYGVGLLSAGMMFMAYVATMKLYALTDIATAEFPTLLSSLLILPVEAWIFRSHFNAHYVVLSVLFVLGVGFIVYFRNQTEVWES